MGNTVDVAMCLDSTSLMAHRFGSIREVIQGVLDTVMIDDEESVWLSLVKFRSPSDHPMTVTSGFTCDRNRFEQSLVVHQPPASGVDGDRAVGEQHHLF
jgi:hypothetical protein